MGSYYYITPKDYETAESNGLTKKDVYRRVYEENWSIERAISTPKMKMKPATKYTKEEKEIIFKNGLTTKIVSQRIHRGWDREKAITTPKIAKKDHRCCRGRYKYTDEIIEIVKSNGIKIDTFYRRVRDGWSIEKASTTPTSSIKINTQNSVWRKWESARYTETQYYSKIRKMQG